MVEERKKKHNSYYIFCIRQVAQGSHSKTSTKIKVDLRKKIHRTIYMEKKI